jgi:hypothetical protein
MSNRLEGIFEQHRAAIWARYNLQPLRRAACSNLAGPRNG